MAQQLEVMSVNLQIIQDFLGFKSKAKYEQIWAMLTEKYFGHFDSAKIDEAVRSWCKHYLSNIVFNGFIYDDPPIVKPSITTSLAFVDEMAIEQILRVIFATDPLFDGPGSTSHGRYLTAQKYLKAASFDKTAQKYWDYLSEGRAFESGLFIDPTLYYYTYLSNSELKYLCDKLLQIGVDAPLRIDPYTSVFFNKNGFISEFIQIVGEGRDLFAYLV